jgi:hypothetical protein
MKSTRNSLFPKDTGRGCDGLPEREAAVVARDLGVKEHFEAGMLKFGPEILQQKPVLEASSAHRDGLEPGLGPDPAACVGERTDKPGMKLQADYSLRNP